jgi:uncharacterized membrane protein YraQ (UPF0718 family)
VARTISRAFVTVALVAIALQLYRTFLLLPAFRTFALTVVSLCLEALPFLLLGSLAATLVRSFIPAGFLAGLARRVGPMGIPLAALTGLVAPVCECAIVPTVRGLREKGLPLPFAITVLVSVPIINPVVIASTIAAFPGRTELVLARFVGGYVVAVVTGLAFSAAASIRAEAPRRRELINNPNPMNTTTTILIASDPAPLESSTGRCTSFWKYPATLSSGRSFPRCCRWRCRRKRLPGSVRHSRWQRWR